MTATDIPRFLADGVVDDMRLYGDGFVPFPVNDETRKANLERNLAPPMGEECTLSIVDGDGNLVGSINGTDCDLRNGSFFYGVAIFREYHRRGYAIDAVRVLLRYYFEERGYHRAGARVYGFNKASIELQSRLGFREEGRQREMIYTMGERHDVMLYGMTAAEFAERWRHS